MRLRYRQVRQGPADRSPCAELFGVCPVCTIGGQVDFAARWLMIAAAFASAEGLQERPASG